MSFEGYSDLGAGQLAILGRKEMGLHGITGFCYIFLTFRVRFCSSRQKSTMIVYRYIHAYYTNVVYYAHFEKTGTGN